MDARSADKTALALLRSAIQILSITGQIALIGGFVPQAVVADVQSCCCLQSPCDTICPPRVNYVIPSLIRRDTIGSQYRLLFHVSVSGTGYHNTNNARFKVLAKWRSGIYQGEAVSKTSESEKRGFCVTITADDTVAMFTDTAPGTTVEFFAIAFQMDNDYGARCWCTSGVQVVPVNAPVVTKPAIEPPQSAELGMPTCQDRLGNPIQLTSGNKFMERVDTEMPSDLGPSLPLARYYNSFGAGGMLGTKWRFGFEHRITVDGSGNVTLTEAQGRTVTFRYHLQVGAPSYSIATYSPPYGAGYSLSVTSNVYTVGLPDNTTLVFNDTGKVDYLEDLAGNRVRAFYTSGVMDSMKNASGRKIVFKYGIGGRVDTVKTASGAMVVRYEYGTPNVLTRAVYADGSWEQYIYGDPHVYDQWVLLTDTTSDGKSRHWAYTPASLAIHADRGARKESVTIDSTQDISGTTCAACPDTFRTFITYGDGLLHSTADYLWSPDWSQRLVIKRTNSECSQCATRYTYDGNGLTDSIIYANGSNDRFSCDRFGNMVSRTLGADTAYDQWTRWSYNSRFPFLPSAEFRQSVAKPSDSAGTTYQYDTTNGSLTSLIETGWLDGSTSYNYTSTFTYNASGQVKSANGPRADDSDITQYAYDSLAGTGDLRTRTEANGDVTTFGLRDELGRRTWVKSPNGDTTFYFFDGRSRLRKVIHQSDSAAVNKVDTIVYNVDGQVTSIGHVGGSSLTMLYDAAGYLFRLSDIPGSFIKYTYDTVGNPTGERVYKADSTLRKLETYLYNNKHQLEKILGPVLDTAILSYDAVGNLATLRDALSKTTQYRYDALSRLTTTVEPLGSDSIKTLFEYNTLNLVTKVTDPNSFQYVYKYDDKGRLVYDSSAVTGPTRYRYDAASNLVWEKNSDADSAGDTIAYKYDALNRSTARLYADGQNVSYFYGDSVAGYFQRGRLTREATPACTTRYLYDMRGRVVREVRRAFICPVARTGDVNLDGVYTSPDINYLVAYVFTGGPAPLPCLASGDVNGSGFVSSADVIYLQNYIFKSGPAPIDVCPAIYAGGTTWTCLSPSDTTAYGYDRNDNLTSITYPSGTQTFYDYDNTDNVIRVRASRGGHSDTLARDIMYAPFGPAESWKLKNKLIVRNHYDRRYLVDTVSAIPDTTGAAYSARYAHTNSKIGNITQIKDVLNSTRTRNFVYDDVSRLTESHSQDYPSPDLYYYYSKNGNRDSVRTTNLGTYYNSKNRLDSIVGVGAAKFRYDAVGNDTQKVAGGVTTSCQYNDAGRLISLGGPSPATYKYDGQHRRLTKATGGTTKAYIPAVSGQPLSEFIQNVWLSDLVYLNGHPLVRFSALGSEKKLYFVNDHLGTPLQLTDSARTIRWGARWYPFGEIYNESGSATNYIRFPGQWRDAEADLYYNWNRYYSPAIGRYIQSDPVEQTEAQNSYSYSGGNPILYVDPLGLERILICLDKNTLQLFDDNDVELFKTGIIHGCEESEETKTPTGTFTLGDWITDLKSTKWGERATTSWSQSFWGANVFGPYYVPIWGAGNIGIHGTFGPGWVPLSVVKLFSGCSHGCVRTSNRAIKRLHGLLKTPEGTKVEIKADCP